jgi:5S rRNA maturation endonuclease (ribonuclease M5)
MSKTYNGELRQRINENLKKVMNIYIDYERAESNVKTIRTLSVVYFVTHPKKFELKSVLKIQKPKMNS